MYFFSRRFFFFFPLLFLYSHICLYKTILFYKIERGSEFTVIGLAFQDHPCEGEREWEQNPVPRWQVYLSGSLIGLDESKAGREGGEERRPPCRAAWLHFLPFCGRCALVFKPSDPAYPFCPTRAEQAGGVSIV